MQNAQQKIRVNLRKFAKSAYHFFLIQKKSSKKNNRSTHDFPLANV
jgi:hypothetical protein